MPPAPFLASSRFQSKPAGAVSADSQRCHSSRKNAARFRPASADCRSVSVPPSGGWSLLQLNAFLRFSSSPPPLRMGFFAISASLSRPSAGISR